MVLGDTQIMVNEALIKHVTKTIVDRFRPRRIVLFGSLARGEGRADSDVDLFVEMETDRSFPERAVEVSGVFGLRSWGLDVVVYTPEEVKQLRHKKGTLLAVIEAEGKVLYEGH